MHLPSARALYIITLTDYIILVRTSKHLIPAKLLPIVGALRAFITLLRILFFLCVYRYYDGLTTLKRKIYIRYVAVLMKNRSCKTHRGSNFLTKF